MTTLARVFFISRVPVNLDGLSLEQYLKLASFYTLARIFFKLYALMIRLREAASPFGKAVCMSFSKPTFHKWVRFLPSLLLSFMVLAGPYCAIAFLAYLAGYQSGSNQERDFLVNHACELRIIDCMLKELPKFPTS